MLKLHDPPKIVIGVFFPPSLPDTYLKLFCIVIGSGINGTGFKMIYVTFLAFSRKWENNRFFKFCFKMVQILNIMVWFESFFFSPAQKCIFELSQIRLKLN